MRIAIDAMGGDDAPEPIIVGSLQALADEPTLSVVLVGDQDQIEPLLAQVSPETLDRIAFDHTTEVVGMDDSPTAVLRKPNCSISRCWKLLHDDVVDGIVSAGNTGAVVAGAFNPKTRRFLKGVLRPGIAVTVPAPNGWSVMLDVGANVHPKPEHLFQYGVMGAMFAQKLFNIEKPTIGLINVGSEDDKGNGLAKQTASLFRASVIADQFHGNIEGRDICSGQVNVIVCDGFVGNIVLKTCEGMVDFVAQAISKEILSSLDAGRDEAKAALNRVYIRYHHSEFGGAPLLGIDGVCMICHGSSDAKAIRNAIRSAKRFNEVNRLIVKELEIALRGADATV